MGLKVINTRTHHVKIYPGNFAMMKAGQKPFDVRLDDRQYERGDTIVFKEWDPDVERFTGETITREIGCKQIWEGLSPGFAAFGLVDVSPDYTPPQAGDHK